MTFPIMAVACRRLKTWVALGFLLAPLHALQTAHADTCTQTSYTSPENAAIAQVQMGLHVVYSDDNPLLFDDKMGPYTRSRLVDLCQDIPLDTNDPPLEAAQDLATFYGGLSKEFPDWWQTVRGAEMRQNLQSDAAAGASTLPLQLSGALPMRDRPYGGQATLYSCSNLTADTTDSPGLLDALRQVQQHLGLGDLGQACTALQITGTAADMRTSLRHLGDLEQRVPGALATLVAPDFVAWLLGAGDQRLLRLSGTSDAVVPLLRDYAARATSQPTPVPAATDTAPTAPQPASSSASSDPCLALPPASTISYFHLTSAQLKSLENPLNLASDLQSFAQANPAFDTQAELRQALEAALPSDLEPCARTQIDAVLSQPLGGGQTYRFAPDAFAAALATPALQPAAAALQPIGAVAATDPQVLLTNAEAALQTVIEQQVEAQVAATLDVLVGALGAGPPSAEIPSPLTSHDTPAENIGEAAPPASTAPSVSMIPAPGASFIVTDQTRQALLSGVVDADWAAALADAQIAPRQTAEAIRAQGAVVLQPLADKRVQAQMAAARPMLAETIVTSWSLPPEVQRQILSLDFIAQSGSDTSAQNLSTRLRDMAGIIYPSEALFRSAVANSLAGQGQPPLSDFMMQRLLHTAAVTVPEATAARLYDPLAQDGCGCAIYPRQNAEIYGFYAFWQAPIISSGGNNSQSDSAQEAGQAEGQNAGSGAAVAPASPSEAMATAQANGIDFGLMNRVAFYGMELQASADGTLDLQHDEQWSAARRSFINAAHRHRAAVDVAIDLRGWQTWDEDQIEQAVAMIFAQLGPLDRFPDWSAKSIAEAFPTLFDRVRPDGVTLIFHGFRSQTADPISPAQAEANATLIALVEGMFLALPADSGIVINLAFELPLSDTNLDQPLFDELAPLLTPRRLVGQSGTIQLPNVQDEASSPAQERPVVSRDVERLVERLLVFLPRDTSSNKKEIRARLERGVYKGEARRAILRSIIPILPPTAHEFVLTSKSATDAQTGSGQDGSQAYGQFIDDVIYFTDNFGGIGFWPIPDQNNPETAELEQILRAELFSSRLPTFFASQEQRAERICTWACPNRVALSFAGLLLFTLNALLIARAHYRGWEQRLAYRLIGLGIVHMLNAAFIGLLLVLVICDPGSTAPQVILALFLLALVIWFVVILLQRARSGPKP